MTNTTIAHSSTVPQSVRERVNRGLKLYREHADEIQRVDAFVWRVPSCSSNRMYTVYLGIGFCTCPDSREYGHSCKHITAAEIASAKRRARQSRPTPKLTA